MTQSIETEKKKKESTNVKKVNTYGLKYKQTNEQECDERVKKS
jgi:hypothetical protein